MKRTRLTMLWLPLLAITPMVALARPAQPAPTRPPEQRAGGGAVGGAAGGAGGDEAAQREEAKVLLERRLERMEKEEAALHEAMGMLDRGEPLEAVRGLVRREIGAGLRDRARNQREPPDRGPRAGRQPSPPPPPGPPPPPPPKQDSPIEPERAMDVLRQANPQLFERLRRLRENDPQRFRVLLDRFAPRLAEFDRERRDRPEQWNLRAESFRMDRDAVSLARRAAEAGPGERTPAVDALREVVTRQFDLRLRLHEQEVGRLNERVDEIRRQIGKAGLEREEVVARRVRELLRDAREGRETPGDEPPPPPPPPNPPSSNPDRQ